MTGAPALLAFREWASRNLFVLFMVAGVLLGFVLPGPGAFEGTVSLKGLARVGVMVIFFLHGANLAPSVFVSGVRRWRVHLLVQGTTYLAFPIATAILAFTLGWMIGPDLLLGFFFLAALPSTVSSAVALTAIAGGNVPVAVFNASLSGLIGLVLTPALVGLVGAAGSESFDFWAAVSDIARTVLLPFAVGQAARPVMGAFLKRHKSLLDRVDQGVILLIIYTSFAASTEAEVWANFSAQEVIGTFAVAAILLAGALVFVNGAAALLRLSASDKAAGVFCGATKSLATGAPMAQILFTDHPAVGIIMLPLLIYHPLQLAVCAFLAQRYAGRAPYRASTAMPRLG